MNVTLFSESLCPDCQHVRYKRPLGTLPPNAPLSSLLRASTLFFPHPLAQYITTSWWDLWQTPGVGGADGIINWGQVVWGNARLAPDGTITCQHGPAECDLNIMQDCAVALSTGPEQYVPFIHCLEGFGVQQKAHVSKCATAVKLSISDLNKCWQGPQGKALVLAAAKATPADHTYVPWATANGVNYCDENGCDGGLAAVCKAYAAGGGKAPAACAKPAPSKFSLRQSKAAGSSCPSTY